MDLRLFPHVHKALLWALANRHAAQSGALWMYFIAEGITFLSASQPIDTQGGCWSLWCQYRCGNVSWIIYHAGGKVLDKNIHFLTTVQQSD
eukprot:347465-Ditylum_brightwellii.AAC.1